MAANLDLQPQAVDYSISHENWKLGAQYFQHGGLESPHSLDAAVLYPMAPSATIAVSNSTPRRRIEAIAFFAASQHGRLKYFMRNFCRLLAS
jgi:hypothetical protein